jgi:S-formylglutathione hydrolase FrmB
VTSRDRLAASVPSQRILTSFRCACILVAGLWALACAPPISAAGRVECSAIQSRVLGQSVRYCALLPASYDTEKTRRYPVLYYLHALGDNEQSLINLGGWNLVDNLREERKVGEFLIFAADGGRTFYINSRDGKLRYEDFFIREFVPAMEAKYRARGGRASRSVTGVSMGGYGALHLALKYPQMFCAVSSHMGALIKQIPAALTDARELGRGLSFLGDVFGRPFDRAFWDRNSPFTLAREAKGLARLKIYFDCGDQDGFGFDDGTRAFHELLKSRGVAHEFHIYPGGHDWNFVSEHMGASMQFHSRAFGLSARKK